MAALEARSWSEQELHRLIFAEVQSGETYQAVATASGSIVAELYSTSEARASRITIQERQVKTHADEIGRVLEDRRTFVQQTRDESEAAKLAMTAEANSLQADLQDIVRLVEGKP